MGGVLLDVSGFSDENAFFCIYTKKLSEHIKKAALFRQLSCIFKSYQLKKESKYIVEVCKNQ